jgi:hypothetical protein
MDVLIFVGVGVVIVVMLLIGGGAWRPRVRGFMRPWQPGYRDDSKPPHDEG